jgi:hypothetical protein
MGPKPRLWRLFGARRRAGCLWSGCRVAITTMALHQQRGSPRHGASAQRRLRSGRDDRRYLHDSNSLAAICVIIRKVRATQRVSLGQEETMMLDCCWTVLNQHGRPLFWRKSRLISMSYLEHLANESSLFLETPPVNNLFMGKLVWWAANDGG